MLVEHVALIVVVVEAEAQHDARFCPRRIVAPQVAANGATSCHVAVGGGHHAVFNGAVLLNAVVGEVVVGVDVEHKFLPELAVASAY